MVQGYFYGPFELREAMCKKLCCLFLKSLFYLTIFNKESMLSVVSSTVLFIAKKNISL